MAARIEIFRTDGGRYRLPPSGQCQEVIATGEEQKTRAKARESVLALLEATPNAKIFEIPDTPPIP